MPYRIPAPALKEAPPEQIAFVAKTMCDGEVPTSRRKLGWVLMAFGTVAVNFVLGRQFALVTAAGAAAAVELLHAHRVRRFATLTLRSSGGELHIDAGSSPPCRVRLGDVGALVLESGTEPAFAIVGGGVRASELPKSGGSRLVLVLGDRRQALTPRLSDMEAQEWLPKIHRFLRAQGWAPPDERNGDGND